MKSSAFKSAAPDYTNQEIEDLMATPIPLVRADSLNVLIIEFEKRGFDLSEELKVANISREMLSDSQNMIATSSILTLTELIYNKCGLLAYVEAIRHTLRTVLIPEFVKTLSKTLTIGDVLTNFNLLIRDSIPSSSQYLEVNDTTGWFCTANQYSVNTADWREIFTVMYTVELIRALTNNLSWLPKSVSLRQQRTGDFAKNIPGNVQLLFSQKHTKTSVELELLDQLIDTPYPEPEPREIVWHSTFTDTLYTTLQPYVHEQHLNIEMAADLFQMSTRTLQRKLQQEKNSFRAIKNSLMFNTATELMSRNLSLTQVSVQLGYADISHFSRAFKRFSGLTPKLYQVALINDNNS